MAEPEATVIAAERVSARRAVRWRPVVCAALVIGGIAAGVLLRGHGLVAVVGFLIATGSAAELVRLALGRDRFGGAATRLEVSDAQITVWREAGVGVRLRRRDADAGSLTSTVGPHGADRLVATVGRDSQQLVDLAGFERSEVDRALIHHGWLDAPGSECAAVGPTDQPDSDATRVVRLRVGSKRRDRAVLAGAAGVIVCGAFGAVVAGPALGWTRLPSPGSVAAVVTTVVLGLGVLVVVMTQGLVVSVPRDEVEVVRDGAALGRVIARSAVAEIRVGRMWASVHGPGGFLLDHLPLLPRRADVVEALTAYGWPLAD